VLGVLLHREEKTPASVFYRLLRLIWANILMNMAGPDYYWNLPTVKEQLSPRSLLPGPPPQKGFLYM